MQSSELVNVNGAMTGRADIAADLHKAISGSTVGYPNLPGGEGNPNVPQALDPIVVNLQYQAKDLVLLNKLQKETVNSTVAQYSELTSYGTSPLDNIYMPEVGQPQFDSAAYTARYDVLKHMGKRGSVSFALMQVGGIVDPLAQSTSTLTMSMLRSIEEGLYYANSALSPKHFDGFIPKILARSPSSNIRDLRGLPLTQDEIVNASGIVASAPNYGTLTDVFLNNLCKSDLARSLIPFQRDSIASHTAGGQTILGLDPELIQTTEGKLALNSSKFLSDGGPPTVTPTGPAQFIPATPVVTASGAGAPGAGQTSKFSTTSDVGDVSYIIQACNAFGRSAPVFVTPGATIAVAQGQVVNIDITPGAGNLPEYYKVFRIPVNAGSLDIEAHRLILSVPNTDGNGNPQNNSVTVTDTNSKLPGTFDAIAFDMQPGQSFNKWLQTGPMTRVPMGITQTAFDFMITHTGCPSMRAPGRVFLWQNVGRSKIAPVIV